MMSKDAATKTDAERQTEATKTFSALFNRPEVTDATVTPTFTGAGGSKLTLNGTAVVHTNFLGVIGISQVDISAMSVSTWGNTRLRVALVLDNTGSMADDNKIGALKTATNNLLTQLKNAATNSADVYVSIIPFVKDVNVDSSNKSASWIDWTDWNANNGTCSNYSGWSQPTNQSTCLSKSGTWKKAKHSTWNGCVTDRGNSGAPDAGNYDTNVTAPSSGTTATMFSAEQYDSCPQAILPLSNDWSAMTTLVNNMSPAGNTNQAIGLAHGWMSLVGGGPYPTPPAKDPNYNYSQVIILLTDGLNTQDRWYTSQSSIDARQSMTCANIKTAGITLYTIQVNTGGDPTSTLLQNCASTSDKFFLVTSSSGIGTIFNQIGTNLSQLRIAR
jgi:uncharacterized protein YegL